MHDSSERPPISIHGKKSQIENKSLNKSYLSRNSFSTKNMMSVYNHPELRPSSIIIDNPLDIVPMIRENASMSPERIGSSIHINRIKMKKGINFRNDGYLTPIEESPRKPSIFGNYTTVLFNKTAKDTKQIFMSAQRRFKGNFLYNTTNSELVFNSVPIEIPDTPGPGTYVEPSVDSVSNLDKNKESSSKGGFGVGFASKTNRFPE